ncbi:TonB-dependent receptor [Sphingobacterium bambusae]|uniref:TonB-dependent receptor n=1 Tax=Sphingobacterium bambusae TaxID=662858 RepID=A0ABW6BCZ4_9SPHI|nr:TonB-dependent receptor [Sphingobacterium bambusae]WPL48620.1 TonB-dependent receptor [Sphingobacterium bambusae]
MTPQKNNGLVHPLLLLIFAMPLAVPAQTAPDTLKNIIIPSAQAIGRRVVEARYTELDRQALDRIQGQTLGETLGHVAGVQNAYFGPSAGAPMIRSLSGNRVRLLANGMSVHDLSGISPNLNAQVDMDALTGIDLYKGAATVLYGGKAIGGAVNLRDNTIPASRLHEKWTGRVTLEGGTNSGSRQALQISSNLAKRWTWQLSGMNQQHGNLRIPGNTKAPIAYDPRIDHLTAAMAQVNVDRETIRNLSLYPYLSQFVLDNLNDPAWGLSEADLYTFERYSFIGGQEVANPANDKFIAGQDPNTPLSTSIVHGITDYAPVKKGIMPNSHADSRAIAWGASYFAPRFRLGIGYRAMEGFFGVPGFAQATKPKHSHDVVQAAAAYEAINTRTLSHAAMMESAYSPQKKWLDELKVQYSLQYADDRELVGIYRVNKFSSYRQAARTEMKQHIGKHWSALTGADFSFLRMQGEGVQRYLPNNLSRELGIFTTQRVELQPLALELGYRHDWVGRRALFDGEYKPSRGLAGGNLTAKDFHLHQASANIRYNIFDRAFVRASVAHAERAPEVNELYAGNDHFAILVEENGDDRLGKEQARTYELAAGLQFGGFRLSANYYHTDFQNYLYLAHTGISRAGGFLVKEWRASDTQIKGWELELAAEHSWESGLNLTLTSFADLVRNINVADDSMRQWAEGDYMPNLPSSRYGLSMGLKKGRISTHFIFERYLRQRYLGKNINPEPPMPAYSLLQGQLGYRINLAGYSLDCYLAGNNLLNSEARPQNSFLKYLAPLPARNVSLGIKAAI